jgi:large subunit ribosomal protein L47
LKIAKNSRFARITKPSTDLNQLVSGVFLTERFEISGRPWKIEELRIKSDEDLHKLWYVLLKEKLALRSDYYFNSQNNYNLGSGIKVHAKKVKVSMARLRSVVDERNNIRNQLMQFLEFYYIRKMQNLTSAPNKKTKIRKTDATQKEVETVPIEGVDLVPTKRIKAKPIRGALTYEKKSGKKKDLDESKKEKQDSDRGEHGEKKEEKTKELNENKKEDKKNAKNKIEKFDDNNAKGDETKPGENAENVDEKKKVKKKNSKESLEKLEKKENSNSVSVLSARELKIVSNLKKKYVGRNAILNDYVQNHKYLNPKEKRVITSKIQSVRAMQAKEIFMKEMAAISYKLKNTKQSKDPMKSKLENLI